MKRFMLLACCISLTIFSSHTQEFMQLGIFDSTADWGDTPESQMGDYKIVGRIESSLIDSDIVYNIFGNGNDIWSEKDEGFMAYTEREGSWRISGKVHWVDSGGGSEWGKFGLMIRDNPKSTKSDHVFISFLTPERQNFENGHLQTDLRGGNDRRVWDKEHVYVNENGNQQKIVDPGDGIYVRLTRFAPLQKFYSEWSFDGEEWFPGSWREVEMGDSVGYGLAITNHMDNELLAHGQAKDISLEHIPLFAERTISKEMVMQDEIMDVTVSIFHEAEDNVSIPFTENIPKGWIASGISHNGKFENGRIAWDRIALAELQTNLHYSLQPPQNIKGVYHGYISADTDMFLRDTKIFVNAGLPDDMGILDNTSDFGLEPEYPPTYHNVKIPGGLNISEDENGLVYDLYGNGFELGYTTDEGFYAYTMRSGAWQFSSKVKLMDMNSAHRSCRAGLFVSNNPNSTWSRRISLNIAGNLKAQNKGTIGRGIHFNIRHEERRSTVGGSGFNLNINDKSTNGAYLRFTRLPESDQAYCEWSFDGEEWNYLGYTDIEYQDEIAYGFALCNLQTEEKLGHTRFSDVKLNPYKGIAANRTFQSSLYSVGEEIEVKLTIHNYDDSPQNILVTETIPNGMKVVEAGRKGALNDDEIVWDTTIQPGITTIHYTLTVPKTVHTNLSISGQINSLPVFGEERIERKYVESKEPAPGIWRNLTTEDGFSGYGVVGMYKSNDGGIILNQRSDDFTNSIQDYDGYTFTDLPIPNMEYFQGPPKRIIQNEEGEYWTFTTRYPNTGYHTYINGFARLNGMEWEHFILDEITQHGSAIANFFDHKAMLPVPGGILFEISGTLAYWPYEANTVIPVFPQSILNQYRSFNKSAGTLVKGHNGRIIRGTNKGFIRFDEQLLLKGKTLDPSELEIVTYDDGIETTLLENIVETENGDVYGLSLDAGYSRWGAGEKRYSYLRYNSNEWQVLYQGDYAWNQLTAFPGLWGGFWLTERGKPLLYVKENSVFQFNDDTVFKTFTDMILEENGSFWVSSQTDGASRWSPALWQDMDYFTPYQIDPNTFYQTPDDILWAVTSNHDKILSLVGDELKEWDIPIPINTGKFQQTASGDMWYYDLDHLLFLDGSKWKQMPYPFENLEMDGMTAFNDRSIVFMTNSSSRITPFNPFSPIHERVIYTPEFTINQINLSYLNDELYYGNNESYYQYQNTNFIAIIPSEVFSDDLGGRSNNRIYTEDGKTWFYGNKGVMRWDGNETQLFADNIFADGVFSITELTNGNILTGGKGKLFEYDGNEWSETSVTESNGENITLLYESLDSILWINTDAGFMARKNGVWISYGKEEGFPYEDIVSISSDKHGRVWIKLRNNKYFIYKSEVDTDPPRTYMHEEHSKSESNSLGEVTHTFFARDRWKFTLPERLYYSHRNNGGEWSEFSDKNTATFVGLEPGDHRFEVRSMDRNWNIDPNPVHWDYFVPYPWYQQPLFILSAIIGLFLILIALVYAINRHIKLRENFVTLKNTQDQLIQSEKMASLGQLVAGIAHEINNPVNYIKGNITPLQEYFSGYKEITDHIQSQKDRLPKDIQISLQKLIEQHDLEYMTEDSAKLVKSFEDGSDRIATIVNDLRQYSRVDKNYFSLMDLHETIDSTLNLLHSKMKERITVHKQYGNIPQIKCSPGQIGQVFMNILSNAIDAVGEKGNIWVTSTCNKNHITISIKDDGPGIPKDIQSKIFDPFFTTKPVGSGTGLGLSISHTIIEQHEGTISVDSEKGNGTEFQISLPIDN